MGFGAILSELATSISEMFVSIFQTIAGIFVTLTPATESTAAALVVTPLGYLALVGLVIGVVVLVMGKVFGLIKARR